VGQAGSGNFSGMQDLDIGKNSYPIGAAVDGDLATAHAGGQVSKRAL
jgi:hypothetical protein